MSLFVKEKKFILLLDISSGSVSGALILRNKKSPPHILYYVKKDFKLRLETDEILEKKEMLKAVEYVCNKIQKETMVIPKEIHCFLASPWSQSKLHHIKIKEDKEFKFNESLLQKLVKKEINHLKKENEDLQIIDRRVVDTSLNGYSVETLDNKKVHSANIDVFVSFASADLITEIEDSIHKTFKLEMSFTSQMLADFVFIRSFVESKKEYIILNIGGNITEISLVKNNKLIATTSFPLGTNSVITTISKKMENNTTETASLFQCFLGGHLDEKKCSNILKDSDFARSLWRTLLKQALENLLPNRHLPDSIFLIADNTKMISWFAKTLRYGFFPEFTISNLEFDVIIMTRSMLSGLSDTAEGVSTETNMTIKTIFINQN